MRINQEANTATASACAGGPAGQPASHSWSGGSAVPAVACDGDSTSPDTTGHPTDDLGFQAYPCGMDDEGVMEVGCFHARAHLPNDHEAVLVDTGARKGLAGSQWLERVRLIAQQHGRHVVEKDLESEMKVRGVGKFPQTITTEALVPGQFEDGDVMDFTTAIVPESQLPALWGLDSMERLDGIVDTRTSQRKMYLGPDTVITPGKNTKILQMYPAESGHLMIPITHFGPTGRAATPTRTTTKSKPNKTVHFHKQTDPSTKDIAKPTPNTPTNPLTKYQ